MAPRFDLVAFAAGAIFALGLALGGMTDPAKVIGFLDIAGDWDPSLAFVMAAAIAAYAPLRVRILRRASPASIPAPSPIDGRLVLGAALFGLGWGLVGYCPGPAIVALPSLGSAAITSGLAMLTGMMAFSWWSRAREEGCSSAAADLDAV